MFISGGEGSVLVASVSPELTRRETVPAEQEPAAVQESAGEVMDFKGMEPEVMAPSTASGYEIFSAVAQVGIIEDEGFRGFSLSRSYIEFFRSADVTDEAAQDGLTDSEFGDEARVAGRAESIAYLQEHYNVRNSGVTRTLSLYDSRDFRADANPFQGRRYDLLRLGTGLEGNAGHAPGINAAEGNPEWPEASAAVDTLEAVAASRLQRDTGLPFGELPTWGGLDNQQLFAQSRNVHSTQDLLEFTALVQGRRALLQGTIARYTEICKDVNHTDQDERILNEARRELPILARAEARGMHALQRSCSQGLPEGHYSTWSDQAKPTVEPTNADGSINPDYTRAMLVIEMARRARASG